jgi:hypothetical protein
MDRGEKKIDKPIKPKKQKKTNHEKKQIKLIRIFKKIFGSDSVLVS